ncbi:hypothetical protein SUGI_0786200 [Cryptomeria japonica]|nr:hypothetical protein SUGI_0786200 [Cryptomeria japonica]
MGSHNHVSLFVNTTAACTLVLSMLIFLFLWIFVYRGWKPWMRREATPSPPQNVNGFSEDQVGHLMIVRNGLSPAVVQNIPILEYNLGSFEDGLECAICLSEFQENRSTRLLPNCNHNFHIECIDKWLQSNSTCPLCRTRVQPHELPFKPVDSDTLIQQVSDVNNTVTGEHGD